MFVITVVALFLLVSGAIANILGYMLMPKYQRFLRGMRLGPILVNVFINLFYAAVIYVLAQPHGAL